ncbi:MAG: damage-inducible protein DinB [Alphaproteobacteria bacterium]|nr:damage-inducible protein DinB [Alphaproteobacteria bacterium]
MARYNAKMNERLYDSAARLSDEERRRDRGAFWDSIHGTFNHLLWADRMWMSRFDPEHWQKPPVAQKESASLIEDFGELALARKQADAEIERWASGVGDEWLAGNITWVSGSVGREITAPAAFLVTHFFNHQTHHRGQAHAMITAAGEETGDTDLFLVLG